MAKTHRPEIVADLAALARVTGLAKKNFYNYSDPETGATPISRPDVWLHPDAIPGTGSIHRGTRLYPLRACVVLTALVQLKVHIRGEDRLPTFLPVFGALMRVLDPTVRAKALDGARVSAIVLTVSPATGDAVVLLVTRRNGKPAVKAIPITSDTLPPGEDFTTWIRMDLLEIARALDHKLRDLRKQDPEWADKHICFAPVAQEVSGGSERGAGS